MAMSNLFYSLGYFLVLLFIRILTRDAFHSLIVFILINIFMTEIIRWMLLNIKYNDLRKNKHFWVKALNQILSSPSWQIQSNATIPTDPPSHSVVIHYQRLFQNEMSDYVKVNGALFNLLLMQSILMWE